MATEKPTAAIVKSSKKNPTTKQKRAVEIIAENIGKQKEVVMGKVLREAGYSKSTSETPTRVTNSKTWEQLLEKTLNERGLLKKHKQLIQSTTLSHYIFPNAMTDQEITKIIIDGIPGAKVVNIHRNTQWARAHFSIPDNGIQFKSLELAYKIGGKMKTIEEPNDGSEEIREVIFRIRKILPHAGQ